MDRLDLFPLDVDLTKANTMSQRPSVPVIGVKRFWEEEEDNKEVTAMHKRLRLAIESEVRQLIIPANKYCPVKDAYSVYVDTYGHPWDARLTRAKAGAKGNEYYHLQLLVDKSRKSYRIWVGHGTVGEIPTQPKNIPRATTDLAKAKFKFEYKYMARTGHTWSTRFETRFSDPKRFQYIPPSYVIRDSSFDNPYQEDNARKMTYKIPAPECALPAGVQRVLAFMLDKNSLLTNVADYNARKLPLGQLHRQTLVDGWRVLDELESIISSAISGMILTGKANDPARLSSKYYSIIPHVLGDNQTPVISTPDQIAKERELLHELADALVSQDIINKNNSEYEHALEPQLRALKLKEFTLRKFSQLASGHLTPMNMADTLCIVDHSSDEFEQMRSYYSYTSSSSRPFKIVDIIRIERPKEESRFKRSPYANLPSSNRRLLWHGSSRVNMASILKNGLQIRPKTASSILPISTIGPGIYFSDVAATSLHYSTRNLSRPKEALLLLADVELGDLTVLDRWSPRIGSNFKPTTDSTQWCHGPGPIPNFRDGGLIHPRLNGVNVPHSPFGYNIAGNTSEYAVYNVAQIRLRYLVFVKM